MSIIPQYLKEEGGGGGGRRRTEEEEEEEKSVQTKDLTQHRIYYTGRRGYVSKSSFFPPSTHCQLRQPLLGWPVDEDHSTPLAGLSSRPFWSSRVFRGATERASTRVPLSGCLSFGTNFRIKIISQAHRYAVPIFVWLQGWRLWPCPLGAHDPEGRHSHSFKKKTLVSYSLYPPLPKPTSADYLWLPSASATNIQSPVSSVHIKQTSAATRN